MRVSFLKPSYFLWVIVPVAGFMAYQAWGLPNLIFSYDFRAASHDPFVKGGRYYTRCTYLGYWGATTTYPTNGRCNWFLWRHKNG